MVVSTHKGAIFIVSFLILVNDLSDVMSNFPQNIPFLHAISGKSCLSYPASQNLAPPKNTIPRVMHKDNGDNTICM
jgi:hypothetical protein